MLDMLEWLSIKGLVMRISHQSQNAQTADEAENGFFQMMDELGEQYTSKGDGSGEAKIKEMMTRGVLRSIHCWIDAGGIRRKIITETECQSHIIAATNAYNQLTPAIVSRFQIIYVPYHKRRGIDPTEQNDLMRNDPQRVEKLKDLSMYWSLLQVLSHFVTLLIRSGMIQYVLFILSKTNKRKGTMWTCRWPSPFQ